jgi:hypothetical protein
MARRGKSEPAARIGDLGGEFQEVGPAGPIRDVPVVRPGPSARPQAPILRTLQRERRATVPRGGALLDVSVKRGGHSREISDALDQLRRE